MTHRDTDSVLQLQRQTSVCCLPFQANTCSARTTHLIFDAACTGVLYVVLLPVTRRACHVAVALSRDPGCPGHVRPARNRCPNWISSPRRCRTGKCAAKLIRISCSHTKAVLCCCLQQVQAAIHRDPSLYTLLAASVDCLLMNARCTLLVRQLRSEVEDDAGPAGNEGYLLVGGEARTCSIAGKQSNG